MISTRGQDDHHVFLMAKVNILHNGSVDVNDSVKWFNAHIVRIEISRFQKAVQTACSMKRPLYRRFSNRIVMGRDVVYKHFAFICFVFPGAAPIRYVQAARQPF